MNTTEILETARDLVATGWIQGAAAQTRKSKRLLNGKLLSVSPFDDEACKFCADGAISRAVGQVVHRKHVELCQAPRRVLASLIREEYRAQSLRGLEPLSDIAVITGWNDHPDRTQAEVVVMFNRAINHAKKVQES